MVRILLIALVLYILYRFVFHFLIPLLRVGVAMKKQMEVFRSQAGQPFDYTSRRQTPPAATQQRPSSDYIDFEEVK